MRMALSLALFLVTFPIAGDERPEPGRPVKGRPAPVHAERHDRWGPDGKLQTITWVEGTVRDSSGRGVPGARVLVRATHSAFRLNEEIRSTTADDQGRYQFRGLDLAFRDPMSVVATAPGHPPAVGSASTAAIGPDAPLHIDLTLPDRGGSAAVAVVDAGKPANNAAVILVPEVEPVEHGDPSSIGTASGPEAAELLEIIHPRAVAGPDGIARFDNLLPGPYTAYASAQGMTGLKCWVDPHAYYRPVGIPQSKLVLGADEAARATVDMTPPAASGVGRPAPRPRR